MRRRRLGWTLVRAAVRADDPVGRRDHDEQAGQNRCDRGPHKSQYIDCLEARLRKIPTAPVPGPLRFFLLVDEPFDRRTAVEHP
jgi:hypothetical protein